MCSLSKDRSHCQGKWGGFCWQHRWRYGCYPWVSVRGQLTQSVILHSRPEQQLLSNLICGWSKAFVKTVTYSRSYSQKGISRNPNSTLPSQPKAFSGPLSSCFQHLPIWYCSHLKLPCLPVCTYICMYACMYVCFISLSVMSHACWVRVLFKFLPKKKL